VIVEGISSEELYIVKPKATCHINRQVSMKAHYLTNFFCSTDGIFRLMPTFRQFILAGFVREKRLTANKNTKSN